MQPNITDRVYIANYELGYDYTPDEIFTITGIYGDSYAVSNGTVTKWINKECVLPQQLADTRTYKTFKERLTSLKNQHEQFLELGNNDNNPLSVAYASLAANTLTTLSYVENLFEIYKSEYSKEYFNELSYDSDAINKALANELNFHMNL